MTARPAAPPDLAAAPALAPRPAAPPDLAAPRPVDRHDLAELYAACADALDDGDYERWPSFFADDCSYVITTKENLERGWSIALLSCESRGALLDRVFAVQKTLFYMPRVQRRIVSGARLVGADEAGTHARASFAVFETLVGEHTTLFATGRFLDVVRYEGDALKFARRTCVLDASLVPNSLPFPILVERGRTSMYGQPAPPNGYAQTPVPNGYGQPSFAPYGQPPAVSGPAPPFAPYGQPPAVSGPAPPFAPYGQPPAASGPAPPFASGQPPAASGPAPPFAYGPAPPAAHGFAAVPYYGAPFAPAAAPGAGGQAGAPRAEGPAGWGHRARMAAGWLTLFVIGTDLFVMSPLLPVVAERYRIDLTTAGWTVTSFSIGYMIAAPWLGGLSDKYGRRRVMVAGLVAFGVANFLTSAVSALTDSYGALVASRVAAGFSAAAITPSVYAATGDMAPPQRRATWLAVVGSGLLLAFGIGAPLGGFLAAALGVQALFLSIALACAALAVLNLRAWPSGVTAPPPPPPGAAAATPPSPLGFWTLLGAVGPTVLWSTALFGAYFYLGGGLAASAGVTTADLAIILLFYGISTVGGNLTGGRAADRYGPESVMIAAYLGLGLCWVVLATLLHVGAHEHVPIPLVGAGLSLAAYVAQAFFPAQQARLARAHAARRGTVLAWNNSALYLGMSIGSTLGGSIVRGAGFPALLNVLSVLAFVSALWLSSVTWSKQLRTSPA